MRASGAGRDRCYVVARTLQASGSVKRRQRRNRRLGDRYILWVTFHTDAPITNRFGGGQRGAGARESVENNAAPKRQRRSDYLAQKFLRFWRRM